MDTPARPIRFRAINEPTTPASDIASNPRPHGVADITPNIELQKQNDDPLKPLHRDGSADPPLVPSPVSTTSTGRLFSPATSDGQSSSAEPIYIRRDSSTGPLASERMSHNPDNSIHSVTFNARRKRSLQDTIDKPASQRTVEHRYNKDPNAYIENVHREHKTVNIPPSSYDLGYFAVQSMDPYGPDNRTVLESPDGYILITQGGEPKQLYYHGRRIQFHGELKSRHTRKLQDRMPRVPHDFASKTQAPVSKNKSVKRCLPQTEITYSTRIEVSPRPAKIPRQTTRAQESHSARSTTGAQDVSTSQSIVGLQENSMQEEDTKPQKAKSHYAPRPVKKPAQIKTALSKPKGATKRDKEPKSQGAHQQFANAIKASLDSRVPTEFHDVTINGIRVKTSKKECMHIYSDAYEPPTDDLDAVDIESLLTDQRSKQKIPEQDFFAKDPLIGQVSIQEAKLAHSLGLHSLHEYITQKRRTMLGMAEMRRQGYESAEAHVGKAHFQSFGNIDVNKMSIMYTVFQKWNWLRSATDDYVQRPLTGKDQFGNISEIKAMPYQGKKRAASSGP